MNKLEWEIKVPIFRNRLILNQLGLVLGIPFGIIIIVLFTIMVSSDSQGRYAGYALILILALLILTFFATLLIFRGTYDVRYIIDQSGITFATTQNQAKRVKRTSNLLLLLGLFSGNYSAAGAGILAQTKLSGKTDWKSIRKVKYYHSNHTIYIKAGAMNKIPVFCDPKNYHVVLEIIRANTQ